MPHSSKLKLSLHLHHKFHLKLVIVFIVLDLILRRLSRILYRVFYLHIDLVHYFLPYNQLSFHQLCLKDSLLDQYPTKRLH